LIRRRLGGRPGVLRRLRCPPGRARLLLVCTRRGRAGGSTHGAL